ncbi:clathrin light chain-domain-containing protein [Collybia nuda]|uniref:Clathrin light chain n=1 Tax=Collybia nuda TaxID=64659 RepID=A0A9P5Y3X0_9AGAR|nr:clathrin light chain-domain-containing protein [Collybia nuda]
MYRSYPVDGLWRHAVDSIFTGTIIGLFLNDTLRLTLNLQQQSPPPQQQPSFGATFAPRPQPSAFSSTPIFSQQIDEEEPQVIRDWREKQQEEIRARDEASKARRQETISKAERSIDEFYDDYAAKKQRTIGDNKDQEAEYLATLSASLSTGTTWERICELIELQNSQSKTIARTGAGTTDLTRFKEVLLRLKREGDAAPGAGGY